MKKIVLLMSMLMFGIFLAACSSGDKFDPEAEKKKATEVMSNVLKSFEDKTKLAEGKTRDETNQIAWEKIKEKNANALSKDLREEDQKRLLYILTVSKGEDLPNGETKSNLLFSQDTKIKNVSLNEDDKTFTFDIERYEFDHKLITLKKQEDTWKIVKVEDPE